MELWQVLLGVGAPLGALTFTLGWLIRRYNPKDFIRREDHQSIVDNKNATIHDLNEARKEAIGALSVSENGRSEERTTTRLAIEGNRAIEYVFNELLPKRETNG